MIARLLQFFLALVPLVLGLLLTRLMPEDARGPLLLGPRSVVRLDPLAMVGAVLLALGGARPRLSSFDTLRRSLAIVLTGSALLLAAPTLQLGLLCVVPLLLFDELGRDWYLALLLFGLAAFSPVPLLVLPGLIVAAFVGVGGLGGGSLLLRPFWLFPLLRSLMDGPWPLAWTLLVPLLGIATALLFVAGAYAVDRPRGFHRLSAAVLLLGFAAVGFGTILGVAGALWIVMMHGILLLWYDDAEDGSRLVPMVVLFVVAWWTAAAAGGARVMVLAGAAWLVGIAGGVVTLLWSWPEERTAGGARLRARLLILLLVAAGLASGVLTRFAVEPVAAQVGAGLSAFGLLDVWPWIGTGGLDPGHRRVALLPIVPLMALLLVPAAIAWLLRSLWIGAARAPAGAHATHVARRVRRHVWWLPGDGDE